MPDSIVVLIALTVVVAILAIYRKVVARNEDDFVHLADPTGLMVTNQQKMARSLSQIDRLGIGLTIATAVYGIALLAFYLYTGFMRHGLA